MRKDLHTSSERTQRERIWRACLIQRTTTTTGLTAVTGIPATSVRHIMRELIAAGAISREGRRYRALLADPRLPIRDPERMSFSRRVYEQMVGGDKGIASELAAKLSISPLQARRALKRLTNDGLLRRTAKGRYVLAQASEEHGEEVRDDA